MYHATYVFTLLFRKLFSHLTRIIDGYSLWINSYTETYGICMECYIAVALSTGNVATWRGVAGIFQCYAGSNYATTHLLLGSWLCKICAFVSAACNEITAISYMNVIPKHTFHNK